MINDDSRTALLLAAGGIQQKGGADRRTRAGGKRGPGGKSGWRGRGKSLKDRIAEKMKSLDETREKTVANVEVVTVPEILVDDPNAIELYNKIHDRKGKFANAPGGGADKKVTSRKSSPEPTTVAVKGRDVSVKPYDGVKIRNGLRRAIFNRGNNTCVWCKRNLSKMPPEQRHLDHKTPHAHGGSNSAANLTSSCGRCNVSRRDTNWEAWGKNGSNVKPGWRERWKVTEIPITRAIRKVAKNEEMKDWEKKHPEGNKRIWPNKQGKGYAAARKAFWDFQLDDPDPNSIELVLAELRGRPIL